MKGKNKTLKIVLAILVIVLISLISFGGIFVKDMNKMKNVLPEYQLGMDFKGKRVFSIKPDDTVNKEYYDKEGNKVDSSSIEEGKEDEYETKEIPVNSTDILTKENFDKMKSIIEKRLELLGVKEWEIRQNSENGEIYISIPENDYTDEIISQMTTKGDFKITDSNDKENVLIPGSMVKEAKVGIGSQNGSQIILLNIQFDKEGTKKLQEISKIYNGEAVEVSKNDEEDNADEGENLDDEENSVDNEENANDEEDADNETTEDSSSNDLKQVNLVLDGENLLTMDFPEEIKNGLIQLSMGNSNDTNVTTEKLQDYLKQASNLAVLMQTDELPIKYVQDTNLFMQSEYDNDTVRNFIIVGLIILGVSIIYAIVKYKKTGLLLMISQIGFIALLLLTIRYTNVVLSITGIAAFVLSVIMSFLFLMKVLKSNKTEEKAFHKASLEYIAIYVPGLVIAVVFSFINYLPIASFGMVMFYAIMLMIIYHGIITRNLIEKSENK